MRRSGRGSAHPGRHPCRLSPSEDDEPLRDLLCRYRERFIQEFGSSQCQAVRDTMPEMEKRCGPVVEGGVRLLLEML